MARAPSDFGSPACGLFLGGIVTADTLTGSRGLLNHIYQNHGPSEGMEFLSHLQRMTTSVSLYAPGRLGRTYRCVPCASYCPSVGIDDCLLQAHVQTAAHNLIAAEINAYVENPVTPDENLPYHLDRDTSTEAEVGRLVQLRGPSEFFVTQFALGQKHTHRCLPDHWSAMSPARLNQIALLAMLATKGSVSNLIQCSHSLGHPSPARHDPTGDDPSRLWQTPGSVSVITIEFSHTTTANLIP